MPPILTMRFITPTAGGKTTSRSKKAKKASPTRPDSDGGRATARDQETPRAFVRSTQAHWAIHPVGFLNPSALTNGSSTEYVVQATDVDGDTVTYGLKQGHRDE